MTVSMATNLIRETKSGAVWRANCLGESLGVDFQKVGYAESESDYYPSSSFHFASKHFSHLNFGTYLCKNNSLISSTFKAVKTRRRVNDSS